MSKALQEKINELFETTKDLKSLEEIKLHCDHFNEWVNTHTDGEALKSQQSKPETVELTT
jgi:hypothetical protein